jgi:6-phosphogluconolactonase
VSSDKKNVYAISAGPNGGLANAFAFDPAAGKLTFLNSVSSGGNGPAYVSVDNNKRHVFVANYGSGSLSAINVEANGALGTNRQTIAHEGKSINPTRQNQPHVHSVVLSPDNKHLMASDLGTDKINIYKIDGAAISNPLSPAAMPFISVVPGAGPRHLAFHPNGKYAYSIMEIAGIVGAFRYRDGKLKNLQFISSLPEGFTGRIGSADIHVSPDGKFLYASNRGDSNDIAVFSIRGNGKLKFLGREGSGINRPRNFAIDPTGNFVLVANQDGNDIVIFKRDKKTGMLTPTGKKIVVDMPVCLKFVAIDAN